MVHVGRCAVGNCRTGRPEERNTSFLFGVKGCVATARMSKADISHDALAALKITRSSHHLKLWGKNRSSGRIGSTQLQRLRMGCDKLKWS